MHPGLGWLKGSEEGRAWLDELPRLVSACVERWQLEPGEPFEYSFASLAIPATRADGSRAVLKVQFPDRESEHEAEALRRWNGDGAVRLIDHDVGRRALLMECCEPGTHLSSIDPDDALDVLTGLLPRLWIQAAEPFRTLEEEAMWWASYLPETWERAGRPFERRLLEMAVILLEELATSQGEQVLLHQDLHADNVLASQREPWLVIDPKPLVGEREFALAPIIRAYELGHSREHVLHRLDRLTVELGLDRERTRGWAIGQTLAWAMDDDGVEQSHLDTVRWLDEGRG